MGGGTEAAKSVSKMIIVDNNLKTIVNAIKQGEGYIKQYKKSHILSGFDQFR